MGNPFPQMGNVEIKCRFPSKETSSSFWIGLSENFLLSIALSEIFWIALSEFFFVKGVTPFWDVHSRGFQELVKHEKMRTICG
jgi:hypothetical protein